MKKISFVLAIVLLVSLCFMTAACNNGDQEPTPPIKENFPKILTADISNYTLICASRGANTALLWQLQSQIKTMCGKELTLETDYIDATDFEILIGDTNREETKTFLSNLLWDDYGYGIVGNKIVIAGHTADGTLKAMDHFLKHIQSGDHTEVFFSNQNSYIFRYSYVSDTFLLNGVDVSRAKIVVNKEGSDSQIAQILSDKSLELCGRRPTIVTDEDVEEGDELIIIGASKYVPATMQVDWAVAQETVEGQFSYYINNTKNIVWINAEVIEGYSAINRNVLPQILSNTTAKIDFATGLIKVPQIFSVMSFNIFVSYADAARKQRVIDTILENTPSIFGVQEASVDWMNTLQKGLGNLYTAVGYGRDGGSNGEHSAIFYRTDKFTLIESGTKWLSNTPDSVSPYTYTDPETGITHTANFPRIMTYAVLERNNDGARFLYVNTHLDHNGKNSQEIAEKVRQGQIEILIAQIEEISSRLGSLPTIVTGDFNVSPEASAYTTMIGAGFLDSSHVAKEGEIKPTYNDRNDSYEGAIIDYIFVSPNLGDAVDTYVVCPAKRNGQWISDHNAIIATITLPVEKTAD